MMRTKVLAGSHPLRGEGWLLYVKDRVWSRWRLISWYTHKEWAEWYADVMKRERA
jgi:hypothetical protein